jgi:hypothetical protein
MNREVDHTKWKGQFCCEPLNGNSSVIIIFTVVDDYGDIKK